MEILSAICLGLGAFLVLSGGVGVLRFPDFFARMHAASITDTLAASLILLGLALQIEPNLLVHSKLLFIFLFLMITSPILHKKDWDLTIMCALTNIMWWMANTIG